MTKYTVFGNTDEQGTTKVSTHRTLRAAGKSYQAAHTGNLRRVLDQDGRDVTADACDAANLANYGPALARLIRRREGFILDSPLTPVAAPLTKT